MNDFTNLIKLNKLAILKQIKLSQLRGRGGAGFPIGFKLESAMNTESTQKYIICNADEGDPGAYSDRYLLENHPYSVLFGMMVSAYIVGAQYGVLYIRAEYPESIAIINDCIVQLNPLIKGQRPEVRVRPPFPTQQGLFNQPTVVNNVETLASIHVIVNESGEKYASIGSDHSKGTKLISLDSFFNNPGIYEVKMGTPLATETC